MCSVKEERELDQLGRMHSCHIIPLEKPVTWKFSPYPCCARCAEDGQLEGPAIIETCRSPVQSPVTGPKISEVEPARFLAVYDASTQLRSAAANHTTDPGNCGCTGQQNGRPQWQSPALPDFSDVPQLLDQNLEQPDQVCSVQEGLQRALHMKVWVSARLSVVSCPSKGRHAACVD